MKSKDYAEELRRLQSVNGELTPDLVLREAKKKGSVLHDHFEWNDNKAAGMYRLEQARELIRSVRVLVETTERPITVPEYVRDPRKAGTEQGYRNVANLRTEDDAKREVIVGEFVRAAAALRRARDLAAYFEIKEPVEDTVMAVERLQVQVETRQ